MRVSRPLLGLWIWGLAACGGGNNKPVLIDAPAAPPDAAFMCSQKGTLTGTKTVDFQGVGPVVAKVVQTPNGSALEADIVVITAQTTGFLIIQVNNAGVFSAAAGKAGRFETPPKTGSYPMDTDNSLGFGIDFVDGITTNADGSVSIHQTQAAVLDPNAGGGMVTLNSWTPAAAANGTSTIGATVPSAKFKGFNVNPDGSLDQAGNGCDITLQNLVFTNLNVKWPAQLPAVTVGSPSPSADTLAPPSFAPRTFDRAAVIHAEIAVEP